MNATATRKARQNLIDRIVNDAWTAAMLDPYARNPMAIDAVMGAQQWAQAKTAFSYLVKVQMSDIDKIDGCQHAAALLSGVSTSALADELIEIVKKIKTTVDQYEEAVTNASIKNQSTASATQAYRQKMEGCAQDIADVAHRVLDAWGAFCESAADNIIHL